MGATLQKVFGIDLGTTYSCVAYIDEFGKPVTVKNAENERITPSVVYFDGPNVVVGKVAKESARLYPLAVVEMVKRSMGNPHYLAEHNGETYRAEEISAFILRKIVGDAETHLKEPIRDVVITCPAYFGVNEREATARAGEIAGLNVRRIINEPTAAAIAYGLEQAGDKVVLVYDLGGGTFDVTMIEIRGGSITVVCTGGDHHLGGKDWDTKIINYLANQFREQTGSAEAILDDPETLQELASKAEEAKKTLSQLQKAPLKVSHGGRSARLELTRELFEDLTSPLLEQTIALTRQMLDEAAKKGFARFEKILLVGGSTRMPRVAQRLKEAFNVECELYDPDESVAIGAAIFGWKLALDDEIKVAVAEQTGQDPSAKVDVSKVGKLAWDLAKDKVANNFGLPTKTVQKAAELQIKNVTSKTFGIVALDESHVETVYNLITRNTEVPTEFTRDFYISGYGQRAVRLRLMENINLETKSSLAHSSELGNAELSLPAGLSAGSPIRVTFRLNDQGRLEVSATEPTSGQTIHLQVETASVMSHQEVQDARTRGLALSVR
jgi:molecular chaperone DnaK (HSP70)